jgi:hypothetical protein
MCTEYSVIQTQTVNKAQYITTTIILNSYYTNSMEHSPWEVDGCSASQEIYHH